MLHKSIHGKGPAYLVSMFNEYYPSRSLRSAQWSGLVEPRIHKKYGERAFSVVGVGPKLWNALWNYVNMSETVDSFKSAFEPSYSKKLMA